MTHRPHRIGLEHTEPDTLLGLGVLVAVALFLVYRAVMAHPVTAISLALGIVALAVGTVRATAAIADRRAARQDPQGAGVIIGTVRGSWRAARPRRFVIPWSAFPQHVLIDGPTGRGKTFTFIDPLLRAHVAHRDDGVFYLDGKGDPIHQPDPASGRPPIAFDHVFYPECPERSACWNPLAGPDPIEAAHLFAAALFPEAVSTEAPGSFYAARAVYAIARVAPAMAYTGFGTGAAPGGGAVDPVQALVAVGVDAEQAALLAERFRDRVLDHLAWLPYRAGWSPARLAEAILRNHPAPPGAPDAHGGVRIFDVTPAALNRVLFGDDTLGRLAEALAGARDGAADDAHRATLAQLHHDVRALAGLPARESASVFQSLQNRLGYFLEPPFSTLCGRSDFHIAEVTAGRRLAFLLPTGRFPNTAKPLGRLALSQFKNAVLASRPDRRKIAVLDEFHNFATGDFAGFLNQARSRGGGAVMAMQSLGDFPHDQLDAMLANISTVIVTPGCRPRDAEYWADAFGKQRRERVSLSYEGHTALETPRRPTVRVDEAEEHRYSATEIAELDPRYALIAVTAGRVSYPVAKVDVERRA
jgi:hypothetical protein